MRITCEHCGYGWDSESKMILVTCPNCGKKTKSPNGQNEKSDDDKQ